MGYVWCFFLNQKNLTRLLTDYGFQGYPLIRWKAFLKLQEIKHQYSEVSLSNRCVLTINKKRFNKLTTFSRHIFLKLIRSGKIYGLKRSIW